METQYVTLVNKAHDGKITVHTEIPVADEADTYVVTITAAPQPRRSPSSPRRLTNSMEALADTPLPELTTDPLPEERDEM